MRKVVSIMSKMWIVSRVLHTSTVKRIAPKCAIGGENKPYRPGVCSYQLVGLNV